jgi:uncharacterized flavoprotein (TIGR03862 family)
MDTPKSRTAGRPQAAPAIAKTVAVVGGGPAGLMAAERLSAAGHTVTVYDRMPSVGRKFLMAGRGGLNLTHSEEIEPFLKRYDDERDAQGAVGGLIRRFTPADLTAWADGLGAETFTGSSGRVFPKAMKASPLLRAWLARLTAQGVTFATRHYWTGWATDGRLMFTLADGTVRLEKADATVLALGGATWPRLGSDARWTAPLDAEKIPRQPFAASNSGVLAAWSPLFKERYAGEPFKRITVHIGEARAQGEAMVTNDGLEGGVIYALSGAIRRALAADGAAELLIDLRPDFSHSVLVQRLSKPREKQSMSNFLRKAGGLPPVSVALLREALLPGEGVSLPENPEELAALIKACPVRVTGQAGLDRAISSAGGIKWRAVDRYLMLRGKPGVFVAGEMLDWDAPTGGYLLQATFASAVAASDGAARWLAPTAFFRLNK